MDFYEYKKKIREIRERDQKDKELREEVALEADQDVRPVFTNDNEPNDTRNDGEENLESGTSNT